MRRAIVASLVLSVLPAPSGIVIGDVLGSPVVNPANGHSYSLLSQNTWTAAEAEAVTLGGHLATVNDAAENVWICNTFAGSYYLWIGLNDVASEGQFVWSSGEPATYTNWYPGEPNNANGTQHYVQIYNFEGLRQWHDNADINRIGSFPVYGVAEVVPPPSDVLSWDFSEPQLPAGWITSGDRGSWVKSGYLDPCYDFEGPDCEPADFQVFEGLAAIHDPSADDFVPDSPVLRIDAWTPEFRFTELANAVFSVELRSVVHEGDDRISIDLYQINAPGLPAPNRPGFRDNFFDDDLNALGAATRLTLNVLVQGLDNVLPSGHIDGQTVYRIRTRVWDNQVEPHSFHYVEMDNFYISYAELKLPGDYDSDGVVDGADFLLWQRQLGRPTDEHPEVYADGDGNFRVDAADLEVWRTNYGSAGAIQPPASIPEPSALVLTLVGSAAVGGRRQTMRHKRPRISG